jgi:diaminopimelate epimerase
VKPFAFTKMSGLGNDFIILDNRSRWLEETLVNEIAKKLCARRLSIGADELIIIEQPLCGGDFSMRTINPDGNEVEMCGNASRCVARYAYTHHIAGAQMIIDTLGGAVQAWVEGEQARVKLQLTSTPQLQQILQMNEDQFVIHTISISGTPHAVVFQDDLSEIPGDSILSMGAAIRYHSNFPKGINANFVQIIDHHHLKQRTYERGVEGETLACGTGSAASSVISALLGFAESPIYVQALGGVLSVSFNQHDGAICDLFLGGGARFVAEGMVHPEAYVW